MPILLPSAIIALLMEWVMMTNIVRSSILCNDIALKYRGKLFRNSAYFYRAYLLFPRYYYISKNGIS